MGREIWSLIELEAEKIGRAFAHQYVASYNPGEAIDPAREAELVRLTTPYVALKFPDLGAQKWVDVAGNLATVAARIAPLTAIIARSEEHTSELQSLMRISYAVFCLKKKNTKPHTH